MQQQMQSMMRNAIHETEAGPPSSSAADHREDPHGRMVVFRSGPGFSSKKTYDFGPDGVVTKTETNGDRIDGDMSEWLGRDSLFCPRLLFSEVSVLNSALLQICTFASLLQEWF